MRKGWGIPEPRASLKGIEKGLYAVPHRGSDLRLGCRAGHVALMGPGQAVAEQQVDGVGVGPEGLVDPDLVGDEQVAALAGQLGPGQVEHRTGLVARLRGEPDDQRPVGRAAVLDQAGEDVGVANQLDGRRGLVRAAVDSGGVGLLDLGRRVGLGPEVGHRRRHHHDVGVLGSLGDGVLELERGAHRDDVHAGRRRERGVGRLRQEPAHVIRASRLGERFQHSFP